MRPATSRAKRTAHNRNMYDTFDHHTNTHCSNYAFIYREFGVVLCCSICCGVLCWLNSYEHNRGMMFVFICFAVMPIVWKSVKVHFAMIHDKLSTVFFFLSFISHFAFVSLHSQPTYGTTMQMICITFFVRIQVSRTQLCSAVSLLQTDSSSGTRLSEWPISRVLVEFALQVAVVLLHSPELCQTFSDSLRHQFSPLIF